jgi:hypothetical protein
LTNGSYRNHCYRCLYSIHVDETPGDRRSRCGGPMRPVGVVRSKKGWQIVHRCLACGAVRRNRVAERTECADAIEPLLLLMGVPDRDR